MICLLLSIDWEGEEGESKRTKRPRAFSSFFHSIKGNPTARALLLSVAHPRTHKSCFHFCSDRRRRMLRLAPVSSFFCRNFSSLLLRFLGSWLVDGCVVRSWFPATSIGRMIWVGGISNLGCWFFGGTVWGRSVLVGFAANAMREYGRWTRSVRRNYWPELSEEVESYIRIWCLWIVFASTYLRTAHSEPPVWPEPRAHGLGARLRRALDSSLCGVEQDKMLVLITAPASSEACKKRVYSAVSGRRWLCGYISSIWFDCSHIFKSWVLELFFFPSGLGVWGLQLGNWFLELKLSNANCGFTIFIICVLCACSEI